MKHKSLVNILFFNCPLYFPSHVISHCKECVTRSRSNQRPNCKIGKGKQNKKNPTNQTNWAHFKTQCLTAWVINNFKIVLKWYKLKYKTLTKVINIRHKIKIAILTCYGPVSVGFFEWWLTIPWLENFTWIHYNILTTDLLFSKSFTR